MVSSHHQQQTYECELYLNLLLILIILILICIYIYVDMCPCETGACTVIREARASQTVKLSLVKVRGDLRHSHGWYRT